MRTGSNKFEEQEKFDDKLVLIKVALKMTYQHDHFITNRPFTPNCVSIIVISLVIEFGSLYDFATWHAAGDHYCVTFFLPVF